jgi:hypothetical protein
LILSYGWSYWTAKRIDGLPSFRIIIPEPLYKAAKIRAVERGQSHKQIVLTSLERELKATPSGDTPPISPWVRRKLLPGFARLEAAGAFTPRPADRDITDLISDDRDGR